MKRILPKILVAFLFFAVFLFGNTVSGQTTGDYRSIVTGNWTTFSSWEYYNGTSWVAATSYPGQNTGTGAVLIQSGHTISIGTSGITTQTIGTVTISGKLNLTGLGTGQGSVFNIKTSKLIVTPGLSPVATIAFDQKVTLVLPANVELQVSTGGLSTVSGCSNNQEIQIGSTSIAFCSGSTNFTTIMNQGGYNTAGTLSGNQYICTYGTTTTTFSSTSSGGAWSSGNPLIATVNSSTGVVTAIAVGSATITYTRSGVTGTRNVYVGNTPSANAVLTGSTTQCQNTTTSYTASPVSGASSYSWSYDGSGATITPEANGLSASISFSSTATSGNLKVTTTNGCGSAGGGNELWITINPIITAVPVATSISGNVQCDYAEPRWNTVSNATGYFLDIATDSGFTNFVGVYNNYVVTGNNSSSPAFNLPAGVLYYRVRAYNTFCTTTANSNTVSFQTTAPIGGSISPAQTICSGNSPTSNLTLSGYTTTNTAIVKWQKASDVGFTANVSDISETTNVLSIAKIGVLTTSTYFRAVVQNQFGSWCMTNSSPVLITVNNFVSAASSTPTVCVNTAITPITHTSIGFIGIGTPTNLPAGVTASFANNIVTISGTPTASGTFAYSIPLTGGSCGAANATGSITVNPLPVAAGLIAGANTVCQGQTDVGFSVPAVTNASSYVWAYSGTGATFTNGTTRTPTITFATNATSGNLTVYGVNACGNGTVANYAITVNPFPIAAGGITGTATVCQGQSNVGYSVGSITNATSYTWSYSGTGLTFTNGTTNIPTITFAANATSGNLTVRGVNACGNGTVSANYAITVNPLPVAAGIITGTATVCQGQLNVGYSVGSITNATSYTWSYSGTGLTFTNGTTNTPTITFAANATSGNLTVFGVNACGNGTVSANYAITVNATPTPTFTTAAQAQTCADSHITYATQPGQSAYVWTVSGILNTDYKLIARGTATDHDIVIEWLTGGTKTVTVNYNNSNGCNGATPATYTTQVLVTDRGQVNGGMHICNGATLPTLTLHSYTGNTVAYPDSSLILKWQYSDDLNNATWHDISGTAGQITHTPTAFPGAFRTYKVILQNGPCTKESIETRINIDAFNAPTFGTITYPTCTDATGNVVLNDLPSGNWTLYRNGILETTGTGTTYTISGLAAGTYTFTVSEGSCTSASSAILNMSQVANIWDGTKWSKTGDTTLPTADDKIVFEGNYTLSSNLTGCSCTVNSGNVIINSDITLTITNSVTVNGGTLTFENNSSLVQINNVTNMGAIVYKRTSFPMKNFDATYWSSPVVGQTLIGLSPNTLSDKYIAYYDSAWKTEPRANVMKPGIGYGIRVPKPNFWPVPTATTYAQPVEFNGVPNNGNITSSQAMTAGKYYLIGNPYPSALDARAFLFTNTNNNTVLNGTIYFWTHNTGITPSGGKYIYSSNDYASFNATGGTATTGTNNAIPSGYIAAGQSFMASAEGNGTVEFNNSMRVGGSNNAQFFKPGKTSKSAEFEKHRLWLNMTNSGGAFKQTLIGYVEGATNIYDRDFDGLSFDGNSYIDFYSVNATDKLVIQGRALPFTDMDLVPLGYRSTLAGDFTISIDQADGNLATQRVYLEDRQTNTINELTANNYTFTTKAGTFNDRFVLRYSNNTLGTGDFETLDESVSITIQNKTVTINSSVENIDKVFIYDITGKQLYKKDNVKNLQLMIQNLSFAQQVLLVKVVLDNGYQTTQKVIFK